MDLPQADPSSAQPDEQPLRDALTAQVRRRIKEAMDARRSSGIEEIWREDADQYAGVDALSGATSGQQAKDAGSAPRDTGEGRSRIFLNITKPKTDSAVARVQEMLVPHDDRPWEVGPTPVPELLEAAATDDDQVLTLADGTQAKAADVAQVAMAKAQAAADKMADWIEDQFVEGDVYAEMRKVIRDAGRLGTGILKGPFPVAREARRWMTQEGVTALAIELKTAPTSRRIAVQDFFPDPACGENIHAGSYVVERDYCTARQIRRMAKLMRPDGTPEYDTEALALALKEGPAARARADRGRDRIEGAVSDSDVFEVFYYYGDVDPQTLIEMGVAADTLREEDLYLASVPAIVTMLNDRPVKVALNPLETGEFPFDLFPWEPVEGQPWGRGVPRKMSVAQKMLVASVRALLENAGISAGPQVAVAEGAMRPLDGKYAITGRKLWGFTPTEFCSDIRQAMQVWSIPSAQKELAEIITFALQMADELTNLPMLLQGQQGTAPELLGGMQLLMQNANAPLRVIAKQYDDYLIVPHLKRYYDWGMQSGPEEAKGDMQVRARGSTALVQREAAREFLAQAYPLSKDPALRIDPAKMVDEIFKANGFSLSRIQYSETEWKQMQEAKAGQPQPQDPRIEAAQIRAETEKAKTEAELAQEQQRMQFEAEQAAEDRAIQRYVNDIQFQIQAMETANRKDVSLADLKAMLAAKAIDSRDRRAEMGLKLAPANRSGLGI